MMYQALLYEEIQSQLRRQHETSNHRSMWNAARQAEADESARQFQQLQTFIGATALFIFAIAAGSTAIVLNGAGNWVYWVLAIWAIILVSRAIKLFAPEFKPQPQPECCPA